MIIAITGGVGSGKTAVMEIIKSFGANILNADDINRDIMQNPQYIEKISKAFKGVVKDGQIDRVELGKKVFYDTNAMKKLNDMAHPVIIKEINKRVEEMNGIVFIEIPLLVETNMQSQFEKIWLVRASKELRLKRILMRDLVSEDYARRIMASQATDKIREKFATDIIDNDGDENTLYSRVEELYKGLYE